MINKDLDGNLPWNNARLINHSCEPNCEAITEDHQIFIYALRDIKAGEELFFNYGFDLESYEDHPCLRHGQLWGILSLGIIGRTSKSCLPKRKKGGLGIVEGDAVRLFSFFGVVFVEFFRIHCLFHETRRSSLL